GIVLPDDELLHNYSIDQLVEQIRLQKPAPAGIAVAKETSSGPPAASSDQLQFWLLDQLEPGRPHFNIAVAFRLLGDVNIKALEQSFARIIERHESLRTTFEFVEDRLCQIVSPSQIFALSREDVSSLPQGNRDVEIVERMADEARHAFDFRKGPLLRAT